MTYIVNVGFYKYVFADRDEALDFAETALLRGTEHKTIEVVIKPEVENE